MSDHGPTARANVLAIVADAPTRELLLKVVSNDDLHVTADLAEGLAVAQTTAPDVAFIEIGAGEGAGLAMLHHLKAIAPQVSVFALAGRKDLEAGAHAVALGGAGLLMLPLGGDEILSALSSVKAGMAEAAARADLEAVATLQARAAGWMARAAELADAPNRNAAARAFLEILVEASGASGAAIFLAASERATELARVATSPTLEYAPVFGMEGEILDFARDKGLLVVPLALRSLRVGHALIAGSRDSNAPRRAGAGSRAAAAARFDGLLRVLTAQATTAFALLAERDHAGGGAMKDPSSSAYSFAYYVDVAGREIDKARRHARRFSIVTVAIEPALYEAAPSPAGMADQLLKSTRDTDVLARVDEHEFHILMPEADGLAAHACRRRIFARLADDKGRGVVPNGVLVGVATFPHDGGDLAQLLRIARRRAESTKASATHRIGADTGKLSDLLETLEWEVGQGSTTEISAPRAIELDIADATALATAVVTDALRGGSTFLAVAQHARLGLGAAVRAALGPPRDNVTFHAIDTRESEDIEALCILAEHGAYVLLGRNQGGIVRGVHAADAILADLVAERLGRAAGLRVLAG